MFPFLSAQTTIAVRTLLPRHAWAPLEATLVANVQVFDEISGENIPIVINLQWTATTPAFRQNRIVQFRTATDVFFGNSRSSNSDATVVGTVLD